MLDHWQMRTRPTWVQGILAGLLFGTGMGAFIKLEGASWIETLLGAIALGVFFGVTMGHFEARSRRRLAEAEDGLSKEQVRLAHQAADRGPVPADPDVRAAAVRIATHYLNSTPRHRWLFILLPGVMLVGGVGAAIERSPWAVLYLASGAGFVYVHWFWPRKLRRRIELLSGGVGARNPKP